MEAQLQTDARFDVLNAGQVQNYCTYKQVSTMDKEEIHWFLQLATLETLK